MNFKLKAPKTDKETLIMFYSNLKNGERFNYSTGEKIEPRLWNKNSQYLKKSKVQIEQLKCNAVEAQLDRYKIAFRTFVAQSNSMEEEINKKTLKDFFDLTFKKIKRKNNFYTVYDEFIKLNMDLGNWSIETKKRYDNIRNILKEFESFTYAISFSGINLKWFASFKNHCENHRRHNVNTFGRNIGLFKTFLNFALKNKYTNNQAFKSFKTKRETSPQVTLNMQEIKKIYQYDFSNAPRLEKVRDVFIFGCMTGMRYSDFKRVKKENIQDHTIFIRETKDKSKHLEIPLVKISELILKKYNYNLPLISDQKFRNYLKELCAVVGLNEAVSASTRIGNEIIETNFKKYQRIGTHTARRSFITNMLNKGIPAKAIMAITGHKSLSTFNTYYQPSTANSRIFMEKVWSFNPVLKAI